MSAPLLTSRLSVAIVTHNEEQNLPRTLASVAWADEILVVDSHSTDRTAEIARSFNAKIIDRDWPGFAEQKNDAEIKINEQSLADELNKVVLPEILQAIAETGSFTAWSNDGAKTVVVSGSIRGLGSSPIREPSARKSCTSCTNAFNGCGAHCSSTTVSGFPSPSRSPVAVAGRATS